MTGDWMYWVGWIAFLAVLVTMVYAMWWSLFADRPRGRQRCPKCWYDVTHSPTFTCPECGYTVRSERQLYRTRRRYGYSALALLICLATIGIAYDRMYQHGLVHFAPTKVVILLLPFADDPRSEIVAELHKRIRTDSLSDYEWSMLVGRWVRGDWRARPPSEEWEESYGAAILRFRSLLMEFRDDDDLNRAERGRNRRDGRVLSDLERQLFDIPLRIDLKARETWPEDMPGDVMISVVDWWPVDTLLRLHVEPEFDEARPMTFVRGRSMTPFSHVSMPVDVLPPGESTLSFTIHVDRLVNGVDNDWQPAQSRQVSVDVNVSGAIEELIAARNDEQIMERMQNVFQGRVVRWREGRSPLRFQYQPGHSYTAMMDDVGVGVDMRLKRGDELARHLRIWWKAGITIDGEYRPRSAEGRNRGYEIVYENEELLREIDPNDERWTMHVRGDPAIALRTGEVKEYWSGGFTTDIDVRFAGQRARTPDWWVETGNENRGE